MAGQSAMIHVTTTSPAEAEYTELRVRSEAIGITEALFASSPNQWWLRLAAQAERAGGVLVLHRLAAQPMVVLTLAQAEQLAGLGEG